MPRWVVTVLAGFVVMMLVAGFDAYWAVGAVGILYLAYLLTNYMKAGEEDT